ncbi:MAG TPA: TIGR03032 family protein [Planctomycetaceae bacterium]|nr:TIGR03032 family protein [Planctomycetaceae bacterium]
MNQAPALPPTAIACNASEAFGDWLARSGGSLVLTTYQAGKVALLGWDGRRVTLLMREFDKPLGLAVDGDRMVLATRHDVCFFANAPLLAADYLEQQPGRYDALYLPRVSYHTGDLHTHDVAFGRDGLVLVNTRFSCLAKLSDRHNFQPIWRPRFVTDLVPEDRCHLNGLAMVDGRPKYVTALGRTDAPGAWREGKATGGVVIDVETDEVVAEGLAMPHSPRWRDGRLWVLNSGAGELISIDPTDGRSEVVCRLSGYLRGLALAGPFALVGMCKIREKHLFGGLPIQQRCSTLLCGVAVVDLRRGAEVARFEFTSGCEELYDVQFLPGIRRPTILNLEKPAARQAMTNAESSFWLRPSNEIRDEAAPAVSVAAVGDLFSFSPNGQSAGALEQTGKQLPDSGN